MPHPFLHPSPFEVDAGHLIGRDPRSISAAEWQEHLPDPLIGLRAIRAKCVDCCGGLPSEVRKCVVVDCALWPLRMGSQPPNLRAARKTDATPAPETEEAE